jgi:hypothetical protein
MLETITVTFGGKYKKKCIVHSAVLRKSSKYFGGAELKPSASRFSTIEIDIPSISPEIFEIYLHWLYSKTFPTAIPDNDNLGEEEEYKTLSACYVVGEIFNDALFKNAVLDAFLEVRINQPFMNFIEPGKDAIAIIYDGTCKGSPARRLVVDMWVKFGEANWADRLKDMPDEFCLDLTRALLARNDESTAVNFSEINMKDYHET